MSKVPHVLGHPATSEWCEAVDAHHKVTEEHVYDFCRIAGQVNVPPCDIDAAMEKLNGLATRGKNWTTLRERIRSYLGNGGLFNPEYMEHDKVRDLIMAIADQIDKDKA